MHVFGFLGRHCVYLSLCFLIAGSLRDLISANLANSTHTVSLAAYASTYDQAGRIIRKKSLIKVYTEPNTDNRKRFAIHPGWWGSNWSRRAKSACAWKLRRSLFAGVPSYVAEAAGQRGRHKTYRRSLSRILWESTTSERSGKTVSAV